MAANETLNPDLGALQIGEDADRPLQRLANATHGLDPGGLILGLAVRIVESHHVHAGGDQTVQDGRIIGGRTEGRENLGAAWRRCLHATAF